MIGSTWHTILFEGLVHLAEAPPDYEYTYVLHGEPWYTHVRLWRKGGRERFLQEKNLADRALSFLSDDTWDYTSEPVNCLACLTREER